MNRAPYDLRIDYGGDQFPVSGPAPRLSWKLPADVGAQVACELQATVDGQDLGLRRLATDRHLFLTWPWEPPASTRRVSWRVRVVGEEATSPWSDAASFEVGLLEEDWTARWISPVEPEVGASPGSAPASSADETPEGGRDSEISPTDGRDPGYGRRPAHVLTGHVQVADDVAAARLYATALGVYEAHVNGVRAGTAELSPGSTSYDRTLYAQAFDVTDALHPGDNRIEIVLADGWYRGQVGAFRIPAGWGRRLGARAELHITYRDGRTQVVGTDGTWTSATSAITRADLMDGETIDLTLRPGPALPVLVGQVSAPPIGWSPAPPVRRVATLPARDVHRVADGTWVADFGQNASGWIVLEDLGPAGTRTRIDYGEHLGPDGDLSTSHLDSSRPGAEPITFVQRDEVVSDGAGRAFEPRHTVHGFRYARITRTPSAGEDTAGGGTTSAREDTTSDRRPTTSARGDTTSDRGATTSAGGVQAPRSPACPDLDPAAVAMRVVHTDLEPTGTFACSDAGLTRLFEVARWSFRANAVDTPTDCPTRERLGWTGDYQVFCPTATRMFDVLGFSRKWLASVRDDQLPDGRIANFSPDGRRIKHNPTDQLAFMTGSAGWGDAITIVPWELYRAYGDARVLEENREAMGRWVAWALEVARTRRHPSRVARHTDPLPHERWIWDGSFHWGEWCEPKVTGPDGRRIDPVQDDPVAWFTADKAEVATAYLHRSVRILADVAAVLGDADQAASWGVTAGRIADAWRTEFLDARGRTASDTQASYVRALDFGLVPTALRGCAAERLVELIRAADTHLTTGFLSTGALPGVLADTGHADVAYELLDRRTPPSWGAMLERGATTMWEDWEGVDAQGVAHDSLDHYSKGAVAHFLHSHTLGLRQVPGSAGWESFVVAPVTHPHLTWARGSLDTPQGLVEVAWRAEGEDLCLDVSVPAGARARVEFPDGTGQDLGPGRFTDLRPRARTTARA